MGYCISKLAVTGALPAAIRNVPGIVMFFAPGSKTADVICADTYGVRKILPV